MTQRTLWSLPHKQWHNDPATLSCVFTLTLTSYHHRLVEAEFHTFALKSLISLTRLVLLFENQLSGLVRQPLRLFFLWPEDDRQDKVLWGDNEIYIYLQHCQPPNNWDDLHNVRIYNCFSPQVDLKPVCKKCYDRYPREMRLRLKKWEEEQWFIPTLFNI